MASRSNGGTRVRACAGKKGFTDEDYADKAAGDMDARYARPPGWFAAYRCPFCDQFHVGHVTKGFQSSGRRSYRRP